MSATWWVRRIAALVVVALGLSLLAASAGAATGLWFDRRGDMVNAQTEMTAPNHTVGDIRSVRVTHGDRYVWIRATFTDLAQRGKCIQLWGVVRTNRMALDDPGMGFYSNAGPVCDDPGTGTWKPRAEMDDSTAKIRTTWDYARNVILVGIPRASLQWPRWVRVYVRSTHVSNRWFSDPLDRGWTPRIYRG